MVDIVFREATPADAKAIAALHIESWRSAYRGILPDAYLDGPIVEERERSWERRMASANAAERYVLLAERHGQLAGFICVVADGKSKWGVLLENIHVHPTLKRQGLGRLLMAKAAEWTVARYPRLPLHLWAYSSNHSARRFYEALGGEAVRCSVAETPAGVPLEIVCYLWRDLRRLTGLGA